MAGKPKRSERRTQQSTDEGQVAIVPQPSTVEETVARLQHVARTANLEMALRVGQIVIEGLYGGDIESFRRGGGKDVTYRKLAEHPQLPFSATTLWRAVAVFELVRRFPGLANARHLGVAHMRAVLSLPPTTQERLLRAAEKEAWSKEQIEQQAALARPVLASKRGRPPTVAPIRSIRQMKRITSAEQIGVSVDTFDRLDVGAVADALETLKGVQAWCEQLKSAMERRLARLDAVGTARASGA